MSRITPHEKGLAKAHSYESSRRDDRQSLSITECEPDRFVVLHFSRSGSSVGALETFDTREEALEYLIGLLSYSGDFDVYV